MVKAVSKVWLSIFLLIFPFVICAQKARPFVLGEVRELQSSELKQKRTLNIYLPAGYNPKDTVKYPVVYLLDGSADEDFIHVVGLFQFNNFEWINQVPKCIVVGIANVDRKRDFTFPTSIEADKKRTPTSGESATFIRFIENELQPYVEKNYKTKNSRTIIGQSLGGLLASEILITKPSLFHKYIIVSPSLWWNAESLLKKDIEPANHKIDIYIGVGNETQPGDSVDIMERDARLLSEKIKKEAPGYTVYYDYLPKENHATVLHQALYNAMRLIWPVNSGKK
ncbi:MAG TPA: alpha/beta hydrolase-fold protein [Flavobacteriales bacterium]|nr:alpha/beta hydrolase-fold protein [Flavobacteriales bacterium]